MSILEMKKESVAVAIAVIVIALIAVSTQVPLAAVNGGVSSAPIGGSVTRSGWAVKGTVRILYPPCPYGVVCGPIYQIIGIGGPACAFPNPTVTIYTVCPLVVQRGTWIMYFTPCLPNATICPLYELKPP